MDIISNDSGVDGCSRTTTTTNTTNSTSCQQPYNNQRNNSNDSETTTTTTTTSVTVDLSDTPLAEDIPLDDIVNADTSPPEDNENGTQSLTSPLPSLLLPSHHRNRRISGDLITALIERDRCTPRRSAASSAHLPQSSSVSTVSTKEEKQRQNEEIAIMESSSVSSETGSWESVFPHRVATAQETAVRESCNLFLASERDFCEAMEKGASEQSAGEQQKAATAGGNSGCFIDASSLMDESELIAFDVAAPSANVTVADKSAIDEMDEGRHSSLPSNDSGVSETAGSRTTEAADDDFCPSDSGLARSRQEQEKRQGGLLFQSCIQQFSGHLMQPRLMFPAPDDSCSDFSLPSVHSDHNSVYETSSQYSSDFCSSGRFSRLHSEPESVFYPDTPHNSIVQVRSASVSSLGAGSMAMRDYTCPVRPDSPQVRRKTDTCPILSGGMAADDVEPIAVPPTKPRLSSDGSFASSWVVDMSDCHSKVPDELSNTSTASQDDLDETVVVVEDSNRRMAASVPLSRSSTGRSSAKKSTGFFIDMSDAEQASKRPETPSSLAGDRKNMFSIFIDIGEKKIIPPSPFTSRLSSTLQQNRESISAPAYAPPLLPPQSQPQSQSHPSKIDEHKRHSWNVPPPTLEETPRRDYKRSASVATDQAGIMSILDKIPLLSQTSSMSIDSSLSPYEDLTCSKSMSTYSNNSNSHATTNSEREKQLAATAPRKRRKDVNINETFDKSSPGSTSDGILSKDLSPLSSATETDDVTFQNEPEDNVAASVAVPVVAAVAVAAAAATTAITDLDGTEKVETHTMESLHATIEKQKQLLETVNEHVEAPSSIAYVRLSDLDNPSIASKFELHASNTAAMSSSVGSHRMARLFDNSGGGGSGCGGGGGSGGRFGHSVDSNSGDYAVWNMSRSTGNNILNLATSVENSRSLSRLFPHLSKVFSSSVPSDVGFVSHYTRSPNEVQSDFSGTTSPASSISRSGIDSIDESTLSCRQPRRLGEDLLKMFLQEIATDVTLDVNGRRMRAHKCILRSRCQYFAAILAGGWVQSAGNVISLPGYSFESVHFALCHIYSGASHPPDGISLMELAALADLLGLEGLKEVTTHALKINYCHNFHKPCSGCIDGVLQVFPVSLNHGLDDLYRKCLKWCCKHFVKVWSTRAFAQMPSDLVHRCRQQIVAHITSESVLNTILDCDHLLSLLAPCRWALNIEKTIQDVCEAGHLYIGDHFASLIASDSFLSLGHGQTWNISRLENLLLRAASTLTPDQACRSYQRATRLNIVLGAKVIRMPAAGANSDTGGVGGAAPAEIVVRREDELGDWSEDFIKFVSAIVSAVEQCLTRQCARAMRVPAWQRMDVDLRKKIQKLACLSDPIEAARPKQNRYGFQPFQTTYHNRSQDLYQVKMAIQAHTKRTNTSEISNQIHERVVLHATNVERTSYAAGGVTKKDKPVRNVNIVSKSSSRTSIPADRSSSGLPKIPVLDQRKSTLGHKRSSSDTVAMRQLSEPIGSSAMSVTVSATTNHAIEKSASNRTLITKLQSIRPRYLEPKRVHNGGESTVLKTQSTSSLHPKIKNQRSSGESSTKTASPANGKRPPQPPRNAQNTLSSESLTSQQSVRSMSLNAKKNIKSIKTNSDDGLRKVQKSPSNCLLSKSNPILHKDETLSTTTAKCPITAATSAFKYSRNTTLNSTSDASSPSSIVSRASLPARKSFLSAKSREILARKSQTQHHRSGIPTLDTGNRGRTERADITMPIPLTKPKSMSCVPSLPAMRRTLNVPTTLHLRKTARVDVTKHESKSTKSSGTVSTVRTVRNRLATAERSVEVHVIKNDDDNRSGDSKLERSSTFCKDTSDIPHNASLSIIE